MESTGGSGSSRPQSDDVASSVHNIEKDTDVSVNNRQAEPPPLLPSVTSSRQPDVGSCHVTGPVATAAIWAILPGRSGADFAAPTDGGRYPSTAEQSRGNYVCGEDVAQRLPYRDLVYPGSYPDPGDPPAYATTGPYYTRIGGHHLTADLPPAPHHLQSVNMTPCDPAAYQVSDEWLSGYDYSLSSADTAAYRDHAHREGSRPVHRLQPPAAAPSSGSGTTKRKRRRIITADQRRAANVRERRRMSHLNDAFDGLRKRVPTFAYEKKLSRIETLRLAVTYIRFMSDLLETLDGGTVRYDIMSASAADGAPFSAGVAASHYPVSVHCPRSSTTFELSDVDADYDDEDDDDDDDDDAATGSCSPGLSCPEDVQEPLELTNHRNSLVDSRVCSAVSNRSPAV